ncbi:hypothetical protein DL96DRAFT_1445785, partial [Flagelloscypha sp. PMI_526]
IQQILREPSIRFQNATQPMIFEVLPELERIMGELDNLSQDEAAPGIIRVAARSGYTTAIKYHKLLLECEVYEISIGKL